MTAHGQNPFWDNPLWDNLRSTRSLGVREDVISSEMEG